MNELKRYCPKCGSELANKSDHVKKFTLYACENCSYILQYSNVIDISFKSKGLAKALSNLCGYPFEFEGVACSSMEAFIQSLKVKDKAVQRDICTKTGPFCYSIREMHDDWRKTQTVYWQGKKIDRHSDEYIALLTKAYIDLLNQSPIFYYALKKTKESNYVLQHSIGCTDPTETLLTPAEYMSILNHLIKNYVR